MVNLPQLPQPPTDNLYKFTAITGVSLLIVCIIIPSYWTYTDTMAAEDTRAKTRMLEAEQKILRDDIVRDTEGIIQGKPISKTKDEEFQARLNQQRLKLVEIQNENEKGIKELWLKLVGQIFLVIISVFSIFLISKGFSDWENKLQKYQDAIVKNEAEKHAKDDSNKPLIIKPNEQKRSS
jgi:hypothetical protein